MNWYAVQKLEAWVTEGAGEFSARFVTALMETMDGVAVECVRC